MAALLRQLPLTRLAWSGHDMPARFVRCAARPRSMTLDVKATKRVIAHEVSDLSEEQKKKLRKGT